MLRKNCAYKRKMLKSIVHYRVVYIYAYKGCVFAKNWQVRSFFSVKEELLYSIFLFADRFSVEAQSSHSARGVPKRMLSWLRSMVRLKS